MSRSYEGGVTVAQLAAILGQFPPDTRVVMETPDMEYRFVYRVNPPCGDDDAAQAAVCLVGGRYV